jgi:DNA helicase-2/ATP-dependent DNA helicase PcrA
MPRTTSRNQEDTGHDGVFEIKAGDVEDYVRVYSPTVLRWTVLHNTQDLPAINVGASKGATFDRVLIFPTKPVLTYLRSGNPAEAGAREKLYVAATRAKYRATFVVP